MAHRAEDKVGRAEFARLLGVHRAGGVLLMRGRGTQIPQCVTEPQLSFEA